MKEMRSAGAGNNINSVFVRFSDWEVAAQLAAGGIFDEIAAAGQAGLCARLKPRTPAFFSAAKHRSCRRLIACGGRSRNAALLRTWSNASPRCRMTGTCRTKSRLLAHGPPSPAEMVSTYPSPSTEAVNSFSTRAGPSRQTKTGGDRQARGFLAALDAKTDNASHNQLRAGTLPPRHPG
jgi:hypothetical protein